MNPPMTSSLPSSVRRVVIRPPNWLGDAVLAAQGAYADSGAFPELLSIYHLFGDPALQLR